MADNTTLDAGAGGDTIATDDIGGVKHQRVKIQYGTDGNATDVSDTNPLPIDDAGGSLTVDVGTALPAGTNAIGKLAANSGVDIGDVDVTSEPATAADGATGLPAVVKVVGGFDGTDVQALSTDSSGILQVDVATITAGDNNIGNVDIASIAAGDNNIGNVDVASSALPTGASTSAKQDTIIGHLDGVEGLLTTIDGDTGTLAGAVSGTEMQVDVVAALPAGNNNIGDVDVASIAAGTNAIGNVGLVPRTSGGLTIFRSIDLDETEEEVKATAGQVFGYYFSNQDATNKMYLKFYNATAANVTVGTTTPVMTFPLPAGSAGHVSFPQGIAFGTAITVAATTGLADNDTGAPDANDVVVNIFYS